MEIAKLSEVSRTKGSMNFDTDDISFLDDLICKENDKVNTDISNTTSSDASKSINKPSSSFAWKKGFFNNSGRTTISDNSKSPNKLPSSNKNSNPISLKSENQPSPLNINEAKSEPVKIPFKSKIVERDHNKFDGNIAHDKNKIASNDPQHLAPTTKPLSIFAQERLKKK